MRTIHATSGKVNTAKFACTEFSEVRIAPVLVLFKEQQLTGAYLQRA
jgi:hypothetical protein